MKKLVLLSLSALLLASCTSVAVGPRAIATMSPTSGSTASGTVEFAEMADGSVRVDVRFSGVAPGVHGFHVHETGSCGDNGNAAGGHFNPGQHSHGGPGADMKHAGDFGNVTADAQGSVRSEFTTRGITVTNGANSVVGRAVILHANPDDLVTQPTGNAGGRIACGVISLR